MTEPGEGGGTNFRKTPYTFCKFYASIYLPPPQKKKNVLFFHIKAPEPYFLAPTLCEVYTLGYPDQWYAVPPLRVP